MKRLLAVAALCLATTPAVAETVHCADAAGEVALEYDVEWGEHDRVTRVQMQIAGDFGISTDPAHEDHSGETIAEQAVEGDRVDVTLRVDGGPPALTLRLVTVSEGAYWLQGGVLGVGGGGLWLVRCE